MYLPITDDNSVIKRTEDLRDSPSTLLALNTTSNITCPLIHAFLASCPLSVPKIWRLFLVSKQWVLDGLRLENMTNRLWYIQKRFMEDEKDGLEWFEEYLINLEHGNDKNANSAITKHELMQPYVFIHPNQPFQVSHSLDYCENKIILSTQMAVKGFSCEQLPKAADNGMATDHSDHNIDSEDTASPLKQENTYHPYLTHASSSSHNYQNEPQFPLPIRQHQQLPQYHYHSTQQQQVSNPLHIANLLATKPNTSHLDPITKSGYLIASDDGSHMTPIKNLDASFLSNSDEEINITTAKDNNEPVRKRSFYDGPSLPSFSNAKFQLTTALGVPTISASSSSSRSPSNSGFMGHPVTHTNLPRLPHQSSPGPTFINGAYQSVPSIPGQRHQAHQQSPMAAAANLIRAAEILPSIKTLATQNSQSTSSSATTLRTSSSSLSRSLLVSDKNLSSSALERSCFNCHTTVTSTWRRFQNQFICNACLLYHRVNGKHRPQNLRTDVVRRRERRDTVVRLERSINSPVDQIGTYPIYTQSSVIIQAPTTNDEIIEMSDKRMSVNVVAPMLLPSQAESTVLHQLPAPKISLPMPSATIQEIPSPSH